jgi:hypothetical protein
LKGDKTALEKDFEQAIGIAYKQAMRTIKWMKQNNDFILEDTGEIIKLINTKYKLVFCVMVENFGVVPFEIYNYMTIDADVPIIPIVMNIYDFEIVINECKTKEDFVNYLLFRLNNYQLLSSVDELDFLGMYLEKGNFEFIASADTVMITDYSGKFDRKYNDVNQKWLKEYPTHL